MNLLQNFADMRGTDKGGKDQLRTKHHLYTNLYYLLLQHQRNEALDLIEIGAQAVGGPEQGKEELQIDDLPSARTWTDFLPKARVHVVDIRSLAPTVDLGNRISFHRADASDLSAMNAVAARLPKAAALIIDDGSHLPAHQLNSLITFWDNLAPGGLFVVEDLHWSPPPPDEAASRIASLTNFLDPAAFEPGLDAYKLARYRAILNNLDYAAFFPSFVPARHCDRKMLVLQKKRPTEELLCLCTAFDGKHSDYARVAVASFIRNSGLRCRVVLCVDETVDVAQLRPFYDLDAEIVLFRVDSEDIRRRYQYDSQTFHPQFHPQAYYRFALFSSGQLLGRCLYVDTDTLCVGPLTELMRIELSEEEGIVGACSTGRPMREQQHLLGLRDKYAYFNAGVLLFDAARMAEALTDQDVVDRLSRHGSKYFYGDQCLLNHHFRGRVHWLDKRFNLVAWMHSGNKPVGNDFAASDSFSLERMKATAAILHFAGLHKPWLPEAGGAAWARALWQREADLAGVAVEAGSAAG